MSSLLPGLSAGPAGLVRQGWSGRAANLPAGLHGTLATSATRARCFVGQDLLHRPTQAEDDGAATTAKTDDVLHTSGSGWRRSDSPLGRLPGSGTDSPEGRARNTGQRGRPQPTQATAFHVKRDHRPAKDPPTRLTSRAAPPRPTGRRRRSPAAPTSTRSAECMALPPAPTPPSLGSVGGTIHKLCVETVEEAPRGRFT